MAAQTQTAWTTPVSLGKHVVTSCTATTDATNLCNWTPKTPEGIDCSKKYTLIVSASAAQDGAAAPIALYFAKAENFALAGTTGRPTVTGGAEYGNITDDLGYAGAVAGVSFIIDPELPVANVVAIASVANGMKFRAPASKYHAFSMNAASGTLLAHTLTFTIIQ